MTGFKKYVLKLLQSTRFSQGLAFLKKKIGKEQQNYVLTLHYQDTESEFYFFYIDL